MGSIPSGIQIFLFYARVMLIRALFTLKCHVERRMEPLQPASINPLRSWPRIRLLNTLSVLADLSSEDSIRHNLGPKYRSECLPYDTELHL